MKRRLVIHPFMFAIFPILALYSHNMAELSTSQIWMPLAAAFGLALVLLLLLWLLLRNINKAGIIVSIFLILFLSYGHALDVVKGWEIGDVYVGGLLVGTPARYVLLVWVVLLACGAYLTVRTRRVLTNPTLILNVAAAVLVLIPSISIAAYEVKRPRYSLEYTPPASVTDSEEVDALPDIYYIILDAYAASTTLKEFYDFDNQAFTDYLAEKGFYVASESRINFFQTYLSLASSLNMEYINYLSDTLGAESKDRTVPRQMIRDSEVMLFLKSKGYQYIQFVSGSFGVTPCSKYADLVNQCGKRVDEFSAIVMQTTLLRLFEGTLIEGPSRERILCTFSELAEVPEIEGPNFVFAHILCPHPPFLFDADGSPTKDATGWGDSAKYLNQLVFVNKKVEVLVDSILSKSVIPPIIILQADHGPLLTFDVRKVDDPTQARLRGFMRIFNAYYLPAGGHDLLYPSITPVNTFRLILDFYFGMDYGLLNDESYHSGYQKPYSFVNVTEKVKYD